ncbi:MAG: DUF5629 family protein [Pseudomonas sp.]|nr:DUF5629 family protein [Pseudomonas sp.]
MTGVTDTLLSVLETSDMLEINGLHCFDFSLEAGGLRVECVDGRDLKRWWFSAAQVDAARFDGQAWDISDDGAVHRLVCMVAFTCKDDDDADEDE